MALIVEDGSIVAGAESYASVADADAYHAARSNALWTGADAVKESALRKATDYLERNYRMSWKGYRKNVATQPLSWPRNNVLFPDAAVISYYSADTIPSELKKACCELAVKALSEDLNPDIDPRVLREKIGPLEVEYSPEGTQVKRFPVVEALLQPLLTNTASGICHRVERS